MDAVNRLISRAWRRNILQGFLRGFVWVALASLTIALFAVAAPKIWAIESLQQPAAAAKWFWQWVGGALAIAFIMALAGVWFRRSSKADVAIEIDKRFGLRERISSALLMHPTDRTSPAGSSLIKDATKSAERLEIADKFPLSIGPWAFSVLIPAIGIVALSFVANRPINHVIADEPLTSDARSKIVQAVRESKMKLQNRAKPVQTDDPLAATEKLIAEKLDDLSQEKLETKKEVLFRLSDIQNEIDRQKSKLGDLNALKKEFSRFEARQSASKDFSEAMRQGKLDVAKEAVRDLADKLKKGEIDQATMEKLSADLAKMAKSMEKAKREFEEKKRELERDLDRAIADNNAQRAEQLKKQLEELQAGQRQMEQIDQLAKKMQQAADQLAKNSTQARPNRQPDQAKSGAGNQLAKEGQPGQKKDQSSQGEEAANQSAPGEMELDELEGLAEQIADLEEEMNQNDRLEEMAEHIKGLKGQCQNPNKIKPGDGLGEGRGEGKRPFQEDAANIYKSQVRAKVQPGETVKYGTAEGPNAPGVSRELIKQQIASSQAAELDPLKDQKLTKAEREHLREYYQRLRDDQN